MGSLRDQALSDSSGGAWTVLRPLSPLQQLGKGGGQADVDLGTPGIQTFRRLQHSGFSASPELNWHAVVGVKNISLSHNREKVLSISTGELLKQRNALKYS